MNGSSGHGAPGGKRGPRGNPHLAAHEAMLVRYLMGKNGLSHKDLAKIMGWSPGHISDVLNDQDGLTSVERDRLLFSTWSLEPEAGSGSVEQTGKPGSVRADAEGPLEALFRKEREQRRATYNSGSAGAPVRFQARLDKLVLRAPAGSGMNLFLDAATLPSLTRAQQKYNQALAKAKKDRPWEHLNDQYLAHRRPVEVIDADGQALRMLMRTSGYESARRKPFHLLFKRHVELLSADHCFRNDALISWSPFRKRCPEHQKWRSHKLTIKNKNCSPDGCPDSHWEDVEPPPLRCGVCQTVPIKQHWYTCAQCRTLNNCKKCDKLNEKAPAARMDLHGHSFDDDSAWAVLGMLGHVAPRSALAVGEIHLALDTDLPAEFARVFSLAGAPYRFRIKHCRSFRNADGAAARGWVYDFGGGVTLHVYDVRARVADQAKDIGDKTIPEYAKQWPCITRFEFRFKTESVKGRTLAEVIQHLRAVWNWVGVADTRKMDQKDPITFLVEAFPLASMPQDKDGAAALLERHVALRAAHKKQSENARKVTAQSARWLAGSRKKTLVHKVKPTRHVPVHKHRRFSVLDEVLFTLLAPNIPERRATPSGKTPRAVRYSPVMKQLSPGQVLALSQAIGLRLAAAQVEGFNVGIIMAMAQGKTEAVLASRWSASTSSVAMAPVTPAPVPPAKPPPVDAPPDDQPDDTGPADVDQGLVTDADDGALTDW